MRTSSFHFMRVKHTSIHRCNGRELASAQDVLVEEEPLEIRVRGAAVTVTMRTPGHDAELAAGFLLSEGIILRRNDVVEIALCGNAEASSRDNVLNVFLAPEVRFDEPKAGRLQLTTSSCGLCGKGSIESIHQRFPPIHGDPGRRVAIDRLLGLPDKLRQRQAAFERTGGLHAAGLFSFGGRRVVVREDIGRHNAVDKVLGHAFLSGRLPLANHVLMVSGRVSFEIMQKALAAQIPLVAAVSAPSSLAVDFARESGQTLVGFLRNGGFNVYTHEWRLVAAP